ncbi:MAG: hypothetical protein PHD13_06735 [Methanocellales archaeon]|nr:hypothetical protein [Methanocellales archaeon]MDD5235855.1 hypothetical protein [Methanocellales archaeon]MDD5485348.1 hypothetical protein [Methanocellales archaeon]
MIIEFLSPFIITIGVAFLAGVVDSITKYGPVLSDVFLPFKGWKKTLSHWSLFLHHVYLGCFAFDLAALISLSDINGSFLFQISFFNMSPTWTTFWIVSGVIFHIMAYIHTVVIGTLFEQKKAPKPIKLLHLVYLPVSIFILLMIRL